MALMGELTQQPDALRNLVQYYLHRKDLLDLSRHFPWKRLVLSGMGASYHASWIASYGFSKLGIQATVVEAMDMLNYDYGVSDRLLNPESLLIMTSQSGSSGEVSALLEKLGPMTSIVGISNRNDSVLANKAKIYLPMIAGDEDLIASKTYLNTLALLWLLGRSLAGELRNKDFDALNRIADRVDALVNTNHRICECFIPAFEETQPFLFLGHGPHGVTARQSAMVLAEWAKFPSLYFGIGAFRHGFIEIAEKGYGAVIFAPPGTGAESALALARELEGHAARILVIENGNLCGIKEQPADQSPVEEFLSPILDIIPVQLAADELARRRGFGKGFRYISKVVTQL